MCVGGASAVAASVFRNNLSDIFRYSTHRHIFHVVAVSTLRHRKFDWFFVAEAVRGRFFPEKRRGGFGDC
jgi:hypothetical protein